MNKLTIIALLLLFVPVIVFTQIVASHFIDVQISVWWGDKTSCGYIGGPIKKSKFGQIFLKVGYSYQFNEGLILGTSIPISLYDFKKNEVNPFIFPLPSVLVGYGDKGGSMAISGEIRFLIYMFSIETNVYGKNFSLSAGWGFMCIGFTSFMGAGIGGGYSVSLH
jgi:hypothetical protein